MGREKRMERTTTFRRLGTMLDCSRNAVMTVPSLKKWIDLTASLGYNTLLLYTEDTYEMDGQAYFGYMRGRYSQKELREVNDYALSKGMELIPCIQTLAHLNAIVRWPVYKKYVDTADILLAGEEAVYHLIDQMFATAAQCFTSRTINIGMDEAHMIGRGKYYDLHGDRNRSEILVEHVKRVAEIGKKYGFTLTMWSDMFFRLAAGGEYYASEAKIDGEVQKQIPDNVELVYWDYYSADKSRYDGMLAAHEKLKSGTWFAGGLWSWTGFAPHNGFSIKCTEAALNSCREHGVKDVVLTLWGDDGAECSRYALLPALFYAAELAAGNSDFPDIKKKFQEKFGIPFDSFLLLDLPDTPGVTDLRVRNAEKYLLFNDCFTGLFDTTVAGNENALYAACAQRLGQLEQDGTWGYLFETQRTLCEALAVKAELGVKTRRAYAGRNKAALEELLSEYRELLERLERFYRAYKRQWFAENKPHGFDVQEIRLGGLSLRVRSCLERLEDFCQGKIDVIEELEETPLDVLSREGHTGEPICFNDWGRTVTANVL